MVRRAHDAAERDQFETATQRTRFPGGEEMFVKPVAAVGRQQDRLAAIKYALWIDALFDERLSELIGLIRERYPGGGADDVVAVEHEHRHRIARGDIGVEVPAFVGFRTGVQIGEFAKYADPQAREVIDMASQRLACNRLRHYVSHSGTYAVALRTWRSQSCRL